MTADDTPDGAADTPPRPSRTRLPGGRRRWLLGATAALAAAGLAGVVVAATGADAASSSTTATTTPATTRTAPVTKRDLVQTTDVNGVVGYGDELTVKLAAPATNAAGGTSQQGGGQQGAGGGQAAPGSASGPGIVTALPALGAVIDRGGSLVEVDGRPSAFLLIGARPMWRTLQNGVAPGPDVQQLKENLLAMGDATSAELADDANFTAATAVAIQRWQAAVGLPQTGAVGPSDVVFEAGPVRVASLKVAPGDPASGAILTVTGTVRRVHVDLDTSKSGLVHKDDAVTVQLPDGSTVNGTINAVGTAAKVTTQQGQGGGGGTSTTTVGVDVALSNDVPLLDGSPVTVRLVTSKASGVLAVPVKSLLALAEGGYGVERVRGGAKQLVGVTPGSFAGGYVQVTGDLTDGDQVVVP